jgi:hypothetical protein
VDRFSVTSLPVRGAARRLALLVCVTALVGVAFGVAASVARADTVTIPPGTPDPWTDSAHHGPLEQLISQIAGTLVGRTVAVRCEDQTAWSALTAGEDDLAGFVDLPPDSTTTNVKRTKYVWRYHRVHGKRKRYRVKVVQTVVVTHPDEFVTSAATIELSPAICGPLQTFAEAATKPTKCVPDGGSAPGPCFIGTPTNYAPGVCANGQSNCFSTAADESDTYWGSYDAFANALQTLAHEAVHVQQATAGAVVPADSVVEAQAECTGMQHLAQVAQLLGDSADDAQSVANFYWLLDYPEDQQLTEAYAQSHPYWSADCKPGGALDVRPSGSSVWP